MSKYAVIDLGSNTFHLLIVSVVDKRIEVVFRHREFVRLGDGGIEFLKETSILKGLETCAFFVEKIKEYHVEKFVVTGTAALRNASNRNDFIVPCEKIFDQQIRIIDGKEEAYLIYRGVRLLSPMTESTLIMDIGGGSTEFIIVKDGNLVWSESYKLGVGVLHSLFHLEEPISKFHLEACENHIIKTIAPLLDQIESQPIDTLIGASGSFEVFESMSGLATYHDRVNEIDKDTAWQLVDKVIGCNYEERSKLPGLPPERVKLIVVAMILIKVIRKYINPKKIMVTPYALKEGLLSEMSF